MTETVAPQGRDVTQKFNRIAYGVSVLLALYFLFISKDVSQAAGTLGIALIFDPFDQKLSFGKRPSYQRAWLIIHLICVLVLFGLSIFG
jgi:thiol:disulfide interchange protein